MSFTPDLPRVDLRVPPAVGLDDALFFAICQANREYRIERSAGGISASCRQPEGSRGNATLI
jgi:hypothetical protein